MKGVILAGGTGTRLSPTTDVTNKHLLPVYDKPMIFYPIETLAKAGIKDIMIITGPESAGDFMKLLGSGNDKGLDLTYKIQDQADGIAGAMALASDFVLPDKSFIVILGDNIFAFGLNKQIENFIFKSSALNMDDLAAVVIKEVSNPKDYGVATLADDGTIIKIVEKPEEPESKIAVTGCYMYPSDVFFRIKALKPSARGELEVSDLNQMYVDEEKCLGFLYEGPWYDAGTHDGILKASNALQKLSKKA